MANREETYSPNYHSVFVESNLDTRVVILAHNHETISDFKDKFYREHKECYPEIGEINISSLKVKCRGNFFRLPDSVNINKVFEGCTSKNWFLYADLARVEKGGEFMAIMAADQTEIASDSAVLVDEHNKGLTLGESLETKVVENKTKKRKMESLDDKKSRKKSKINLDQSAVATTSSGDVVDESHELGGKVQLEDDILAGALLKDIENGEKNGISMGENQQSSDADMLCQEKSITNNSELVEGYTRDEAKYVQASQTLKEVPSEKIDDLTGATFENTGNVDRVDATFESLAVSERGNIGNPLAQAIQKENEMGEKIDDDVGIGRAISSAADYIQTDNIVSYPENQLGVSSGLTTGTVTEKKKRPKKSSKDHVNQSTTTTISREIVNEREKVSGSIDHVDATSEVFPDLRGENPVTLVETIQNENEMGYKFVDKVGSIGTTPNGADEIQAEENVQVADLATTLPALVQESKTLDHIGKFSDDKRTPEHDVAKGNGEIDADEAKSVKSTKKKKSRETKTANGAVEIQAEDNVQVADLATTLPALVQESKTVDHIGKFTDDKRTAEHDVAKENGQIDADEAKSVKSTKKKKSRKTETPNGADEIQAEDNVQVTDLTTTLPAVFQESKTLDHIGKFTNDKRTAEHDVAKDNGEIDADEAKSVKSTKKKKSRKTKTPNGADEIQAEDNVQVADLATTLPTLVQESKTVDHIGKFADDKRTAEHEVAKDNGEIVADEAKSVKSTKKRKSRKAQTSAMEDTLVDSGLQNVEPFKVVDGEGPDNVIRNVLDSLHQRNEAQGSLDKTEKKASKRSKKRLSSNIVESQVLPVEVNNAQEAAPPFNNPENTDATWMPVKKDTESNGPRLKKHIEVADNNEEYNLSQQTQKEKANMADNFGSRQKEDTVVGKKKQDKVTGGAKSKKEKKSLDLHPGGSIDGSLSSKKPKERSSKVQPASSGTSHLKSKLKNDRSGSKVDDSITSVKKNANPLTVNKNKLNFFKDAEEWNSLEDEFKRTSPHVSTKTPPDSSSDDDSDVTSTSRKQGNNVPGATNEFTGSLQDILRSSRSYKKAKETASQYMSDDESPAIDIVPDSQAN